MPCDCLAYLSEVSRPWPGESPADSQLFMGKCVTEARSSAELTGEVGGWAGEECQQQLVASRYCWPLCAAGAGYGEGAYLAGA